MSHSPNTKKVALVTGATGAIGAAIAKGLLAAHYSLILPVRNASKAQALVQQLSSSTPSASRADIQLEDVDFADSHSIVKLCEHVTKKYPRLDVLINNAAVVPRTKEMTKDGIEMQFGVNVYGYFLMMTHLHSLLSHTAASQQHHARIVNVASNYASGLDLNDLQFTKRRYSPDEGYRQSKQANRMMSYYAADLWKKDGITVNAVHPGFVPSNVCRGLGFNGTESADKGAATPIYAATSADLENVTGQWIVDNRPKSCPYQNDKQAQEQLWKYCEAL